MPSRIGEVVVDAQHDDAGELHAIDVARRRAAAWLSGDGRRERHLDRETASRGRPSKSTVDLVVEHARDALDDRQAEAQAARHLGALIEAVEFLEDRLLLRMRDAEPGIVDVDAQPPAPAPAADQHAAVGRVLDGVGDQVLQQPAQQPAVGLHRERGGHEFELRALLLRQRREFDLELAQQLVDAEADDLGLHRAGIEPRDVEQRAEDLLDRVERGIDVADELRVLAAALPLDQAGDVEPRGVERLQDVVARGGEEAGLGDVGLVGLAPWRGRARC